MAGRFQPGSGLKSGVLRQLKLHGPRATMRARLLLAIWALLTFAAISVVAVLDYNRAQTEFSTLADRYLAHVSDRALVSETAIEGFAAFTRSMQIFDHAKAEAYAQQLLDRYPFLYMFEVAQRVDGADRAAFERKVAVEYPGFFIKRFSYESDRRWRPSDPQPFHYPLVFQLPLLPGAGNLMGLDIHSSDLLRVAMEASFERGHPVATQPFELAEGGRGYVLHRSLEHVGKQPPGAFAAERYALLAVMSDKLFSELSGAPSRFDIRLSHREFDGEPGTVLARPARSVDAIERALLPRFETRLKLKLDSQPFVLQISWQQGWADLDVLAMLSIIALSLLGFVGVRVYAQQYIEEELRELENQGQLYAMANFDPLTGLANRNRLTDFLETAIAHAKRQSHNCFVLFIDLNGFKQINDKLGHAAGDRVLVHVANSLSEQLRHDELLARYGGDEFVWVTAGMDDRDALEPLVARLHAACAEPLTIGDVRLSVSASIGCAVYPQDGKNIDALFRAADEAMYRDKRRKNSRPATTIRTVK